MQSGRSLAAKSLSVAAVGLVSRFFDGGRSSCEDPVDAEPVPRRHGCRRVLATSDASAAKHASHAAGLKRGVTTEPTRKKLDDAFDRRCSTTLDGKAKPPSTSNPRDKACDDSYPTFTQYHHSLLKKYLTPELWSRISNLTTAQGTTIEDIIKAGLALPLGANPPRRVGVLVGDAECYSVFSELLDPIILEYHGIKSFADWHDPELPSGTLRTMALWFSFLCSDPLFRRPVLWKQWRRKATGSESASECTRGRLRCTQEQRSCGGCRRKRERIILTGRRRR